MPVRLLVVAALAQRRRWIQLGAFLGAVVTSELCIGPLKALIDRPRPDAALVSAESAAFPSGHAIVASVTAIGLVIVLVPPRRRRTRWTLVAACFALLMAMSRTYLGVHWASDVVAGACIGTGLAVAWPAALELARSRVVAAPHWPLLSRVVTVVLLSVGLACVVALHWLRPDLDPTAHRISEYAIGPHGSFMAMAFVSIGAGLLALVWPFAAAGGPWSRPVAATVAVAGIGMIVAGLFPTDPIRSGPMADLVHSQASAVATIALDRGRAGVVRRAPAEIGDTGRRRARCRGRGARRRQPVAPPFGVDGHEPAGAVVGAGGLAPRHCVHHVRGPSAPCRTMSPCARSRSMPEPTG